MYKIQLPNFEGPFDLLLYFIRRDEIDIYDIPIAKLSEEFLSYIRLMKFFDLELAGDFILMASTLMYIKSQLLLPKEVNPETGEIEDPRTELVQRLLEYKQFKEAGEQLNELAEQTRYNYYRNLFDAEQSQIDDAGTFKNATLFDLLKAFKKVIDRNKPVEVSEHIVNMVPVSVDDQKEEILSELKKQKRLSFIQLVKQYTLQRLVVTFLALLDLARMKNIYIIQDDVYDDIILMDFIPEVN